uniref:Glycerol kinase 5 n=1 Tax=Clastoptera arizonana TaxID=38151 RepID=A0A1B6DGB8_9HEMI
MVEPKDKHKVYIASLDVGTTTVRCHIINGLGEEVSRAKQEITLLYPQPGHVEINPDQLWENVVQVIKEAIKGASIQASDIKCLGISSQRCTFITWNRFTGRYYHNLITWKDLRADSIVKRRNNSYSLMCLRGGAKLLYTITRSKRFLAGSVLKLMNAQVVCRLEWVLKNVPGVFEASIQGSALFGTIDTWLLYRLTNGRLHVTDVSCASATALFDPFTMHWADWALYLFQIPVAMLPTVCDTAGDHFGSTSPEILGAAIPIRSSMADQSASMYGSCCFNEGDVKLTMGTGTFLNVNTGKSPHASVAGLYPVVGWRVRDELVYLVEGSSYDTGCLINWIQNMGLVFDVTETSDKASSVIDNGGVYFVPAFSGLQAPVNDCNAAAGFIGIKPTSTTNHVIRAVLESIACRVAQLYNILLEETDFSFARIRVDGGVSRNNFVLQLLSNLTGLITERPQTTEMTSMGAAFLAGLACGTLNCLNCLLLILDLIILYFVKFKLT